MLQNFAPIGRRISEIPWRKEKQEIWANARKTRENR